MLVKVIIAGPRDYNDYPYFRMKCLISLSEIMTSHGLDFSRTEHRNLVEIISGHARGVDSMGERLAVELGMQLKVMPAEWSSYGKSAGPRRNGQMADYALEVKECHLIAFISKTCVGTKNMVELAYHRNIPTIIHNV